MSALAFDVSEGKEGEKYWFVSWSLKLLVSELCGWGFFSSFHHGLALLCKEHLNKLCPCFMFYLLVKGQVVLARMSGHKVSYKWSLNQQVTLHNKWHQNKYLPILNEFYHICTCVCFLICNLIVPFYFVKPYNTSSCVVLNIMQSLRIVQVVVFIILYCQRSGPRFDSLKASLSLSFWPHWNSSEIGAWWKMKYITIRCWKSLLICSCSLVHNIQSLWEARETWESVLCTYHPIQTDNHSW